MRLYLDQQLRGHLALNPSRMESPRRNNFKLTEAKNLKRPSMNLLATTTILSLLATGTGAAGDYEVSLSNRPIRHLKTHMWMFGENGVSIFTPDGSQEVKTISPDHVCKNVTSDDGSSRIRCDFNDVVSDGHKYVWASVARGVPKIDIFRIDTGDLVGSFDTCGSPRDLDYHPLREEIWVHCSEYSEMAQSHLDVFSATTPAAPLTTTITMHDNSNLRSWGKLQVHADLGDVAYSTVSGQPTLYKIDVAERRVLEEIDVSGGNPSFYGVYDLEYSPVNGHLYARTEVCCTCGFVGADTLECGRYGSYNITIEGNLVEGQCGRHCQGGPQDTIGVIEFDTKTSTIVGTHNFVGSAPVYAPFSSPDGKYIVMFGLDGGQTVEILEAGANGEKSEVAFTLKLDFNTTNVEDYAVFRDFAYIKTAAMNCFIVSSSADYKVALIDMDTLEASYIMLKDVPYEGRSSTRQVEWAEGTKYVWIGGRSDDEVYVIDIEAKKVIRTFTEVDPRKLLSVSNNHFMGMADAYADYFNNNGQFMSDESGGKLTSSRLQSSDSGDGNTLSIVALALSCVAIAAVVVSLFANKSGASDSKDNMVDAAAGKADMSLAVPSVQ